MRLTGSQSPAHLYQLMSWTHTLSQPIGGFRRLSDTRFLLRVLLLLNVCLREDEVAQWSAQIVNALKTLGGDQRA